MIRLKQKATLNYLTEMLRLAGKIVLGAFCAAALAAVPARAADIAVLRNGFSIRHERREVNGATTRLYLTAGNSGYVDIPSSQIDHFEKDLTPSPASPGGGFGVSFSIQFAFQSCNGYRSGAPEPYSHETR